MVELHQELHVAFGHGPPECVTSQHGNDLLRARILIGGASRTTDENLLATRRVTDTRGVEGPLHLEIAETENPILAAAGKLLVEPVVRLGKCPVQEGHRHLVRACGGLEADALEARIDGVDRRVLLLVDGLQVLLATDIALPELLAVECCDECVLELQVGDPERDGKVADVELVFTVGGKLMLHQQAAAGSERHTVDVEELRRRVLHDVLGADRVLRNLAYGIDGDAACGRKVLIQEGR